MLSLNLLLMLLIPYTTPGDPFNVRDLLFCASLMPNIDKTRVIIF